MPRLRVLSGDEVVKIFEQFNFVVIGQRGSHIKLRRIAKEGLRQTIIIPRHAELDRGTLGSIYSRVLRYIPESDLRDKFYS